MAAAFGQLAPSLLENIKTSCKHQAEAEVSQPEERGAVEPNQKNNSEDAVSRAGFAEE